MLVNGFSGHGFQQCHAVGRYLAEITLGRTPTLDLSIFSPQRLLDNTPVYENSQRIV
jgi:glycine/D-amino acid oxidase-like deaminating enzyme